MAKCKQCGSAKTVKNGTVRKKQRYKCKVCGINFVEGDMRRERNMDKQRLAIHLYLENMGFRAIGRVLGVSNVTVLNWIRSAEGCTERHHRQQEPHKKAMVMELDEMWHFIDSKKESYGFGLHWTEQGSVFLTLPPGTGRVGRERGHGTK